MSKSNTKCQGGLVAFDVAVVNHKKERIKVKRINKDEREEKERKPFFLYKGFLNTKKKKELCQICNQKECAIGSKYQNSKKAPI